MVTRKSSVYIKNWEPPSSTRLCHRPQVVVTKRYATVSRLGVTDFEQPMVWATNNVCENAMRLCREWGATDIDMAMVWAASGGYESTVRLCYDWGAQEIDLAMTSTADEGRESVVRLCRYLGLPQSNRLCCKLQAMVTNL